MAIAAIGQICSTQSMSHNLGQCVRLISKAAAAGAKILFLPEASDYIATSPAESLSLAQPVAKSPFVTGLQSAARQHNLAVTVGIHVPVAAPVHPGAGAGADSSTTTTTTTTATTKLLNRTIYIRPDGTIDDAASYDKLHLFDFGALRESAHTQAGARLAPPVDTPAGRLGALVCFDLRFPEASLALAQPGAGSPLRARPAQILAYPSAFTVPTGRAHWEVLLRARAVEAQCYVFAAAQVGRHHGRAGSGSGRVSYGCSMAVGPWGEVLCRLGGVTEDGEAEEGAVEALGLVDVDLEEWARVRERMPLVRRTDVYPEI